MDAPVLPCGTQLVVLVVVLIATSSCGAVGIMDSTIAFGLAGRHLTPSEQIYWVLLPFIPVIGVIFKADMWLAKCISDDIDEQLDAIQKDSKNVKDSVRSSWQTMGVVGALLLGLATSALMGKGPYTSLSQLWYVVMLWLSMGYSLKTVAYVSLSTLYTNVLDDGSDGGNIDQFKPFIKKNLYLVGSPSSGIAVTVFTTCAAANLYVYQSAGIVVGILTNVLWAAIVYLIVTAGLLASKSLPKRDTQAQAEAQAEVRVYHAPLLGNVQSR